MSNETGDVTADSYAFSEALRATTSALTSTLDLDEVLDRILASVGSVVPHDSANIALIDEDTEAVRLVRWVGYDRYVPTVEPLLQRTFDVATTHSIQQIVSTQQPLIIDDTLQYPGWIRYPESDWIRSHLGAPIRVRGRTLGILALDKTTPNFFTPLHAERLTAFADQAAIAIENARLYAAMQGARDAAEAANRAKSAFLATMSHEIRTPLNAVLGMATLLLDTPLSVDQQEYVRTIRTSGDALLSVINDVLDFSKIESGRLELETYPLAVRDCIGDVLALVAHRANEKGLTLTGNVDPAVPSFVLGDPSRLRQVLLNLVSNAVKFTERGEVCVSADVYAGESLSLHFAVSDSGIGIASERMHQLFDSFSQLDASMTRRYGGSGLGLAISRRLTELMGGSLWVESTLGQGSTFHFTIATAPLSVDPGNTEQRGTMPLISDLGASFPCQILLVEDNIVNQKVAQHLLGRMGYHADVAANGVEAIAALQSQRYDVLLMDLHMPEMDGLEATRIIRRQLPPDSQPVIVAMTAAALLEDQKASVEAGMDAFITKPVRLEQLVDVLRSVCRNRTYVKRQDTKVDDLQL